MIPDSTRIFFGYLLDAANYQTFTWQDLVAAEKAGADIVNSPLNSVQTMASSADDMVAYYSASLQGAFFANPATLTQFREILAMCGTIWLVPLPLGVSAFAKGGSIDVPGFHAVCVPGGMFFDDRWVFFCLTINWYAPAETDTDTVSAFLAAASQRAHPGQGRAVLTRAAATGASSASSRTRPGHRRQCPHQKRFPDAFYQPDF